MNARMATLDSLCTIQSGGTPSRRNPDYFGGSIPWAKIGDLSTPTGIVAHTEESITAEGLEAINNRFFPPGTILLAMYGSVGKTAIAGCSMATNQAILGINVTRGDLLEPRYLHRWLDYMQPALVLDARGVTQKNISATIVRNLEVPLPPIEEQRRIAAILDKADAIRRKRQEAIALTDDLLRSTFLEMFGDPVTNPKGWPVVTLKSLVSELRYGTSKKCHEGETDGDLPVLRIPNVVGGRVDWTELKYTQLSKKEIDKLRLSTGDIVFVRSNGNPEYIGRCAVYEEGSPEALFASYLIRARFRAGAALDPRFVRDLISFPTYRSRLVREARTTAGNYNISTKGLGGLRLIVPPADAQQRYLDFVASVNAMTAKMKTSATDSDRLFHSLVQRAFRGEL